MNEEIDRFKNIVDNIFDKLESSTKKEEVNSPIYSVKTDKLNTKEEEFAKEKALEELETIRVAFLALQDTIHGLMMFNYITSSLQDFAEYASNLTEVIEDEIDENHLTPESLKKYQRIKKLRTQILSNIYNKYKEDKGGI